MKRRLPLCDHEKAEGSASSSCGSASSSVAVGGTRLVARPSVARSDPTPDGSSGEETAGTVARPRGHRGARCDQCVGRVVRAGPSGSTGRVADGSHDLARISDRLTSLAVARASDSMDESTIKCIFLHTVEPKTYGIAVSSSKSTLRHLVFSSVMIRAPSS